MGIILDTSVLIALERETVAPDVLIRGRENEPFGMSVISVAEMLHGVHRAKPLARRIKRETFVERLISELTCYPFDVAAARVYAGIWADLAGRGMQVAAHDLLIASTAISLGYEVLTSNERDFGRIQALKYSVV